VSMECRATVSVLKLSAIAYCYVSIFGQATSIRESSTERDREKDREDLAPSCSDTPTCSPSRSRERDGGCEGPMVGARDGWC